MTSIIRDKNYYGQALTKPAVTCWDRVWQSWPKNSKISVTIIEIVKRNLAFIALLFMGILFVPGIFCKSINAIVTPRSPKKPISIKTNDAIVSPHSLKKPISITTNNLILDEPELQKEKEILNEMNSFSNNSTWENYQFLPLISKYLIAARYTVNNLSFWRLHSSYGILKLFEEKFSKNTEIIAAKKSINEAIIIQNKILFLMIFKKIIKKGLSVQNFAQNNDNLFQEIKNYLKKRLSVPEDFFTKKDLSKRLNTEETLKIIDGALFRLQNGHLDFPNYRDS